MLDRRDQLSAILEEMILLPADPEVDSALRLLKAFLRLRDETTRVAVVRLVESLARH